MPPTLRDPVLDDQLRRLGFVVVPFLSEDDLSLLRSTYEALGPAPDDPRLSIYFDYQSSSEHYKRKVVELIGPVLTARGSELLVDHHLFYPEYIAKWPGARSGFAPHLDVTFVEEPTYRTVSTWCPLTDVTGDGGVDNGMVWLVPGSHRFADWPQAFEPDFTYGGLEQVIIEELGVGVPVRAGEALVFDHRIIHFSLPNGGESPRLAVDGNWRPEAAQLLHYRHVAPDEFETYAIDDDFFCTTNPSSLKDGPPTGARFVRRWRAERPHFTAEQLTALADAVQGPLPQGLSRDARSWMDTSHGNSWYQMVNDDWRLRAVPFCATCGAEDDLRPLDAPDASNVRYVCGACSQAADAATMGVEAGVAPHTSL